MTVRELRELLTQFDQDLPVAVIDDGVMQPVTLAKVEEKLWDATAEKPILILW